MVDKNITDNKRSTSALPVDVANKVKAGVALYRAGKLGDATNVFTKIIRSNPEAAIAHYNLGLIALSQKKVPVALKSFENCLKYAPKSALANAKIAECHGRSGNLEKSIPYLEASLMIRPDQLPLLTELGRLHIHFKNWKKAYFCYNKAVTLQPDNASLLNNYGNVCYAIGRSGDAQKAYHGVIKLDPDNAQAYYNLANLHLRAGNETAARNGYLKTLQKKPQQLQMLQRMGNLFEMWRYHKASAQCFEAAQKIQPDNIAYMRGLARALANSGKTAKALELFNKIAKIKPDDWVAHYDLADTYVKCQKIPESVEQFRITMKLKPDHYLCAARLFFHQREICDWEGLEELNTLLDDAISNYENVENPSLEPAFINISRSENPEQNYINSRALAMKSAEFAKRHSPDFDYAPALAIKDKIHLGYLSFDFRDHPTSHLIAGLFEQHDRDRFHITAYSYGQDDKGVHRKRIENGVDKFVNLVGLGDLESARKIHAEGTQILIDLMGHTTGTRLVIPALRPAPVQMYYLGYPGTIGGDYFDYTLVDNIIAPRKEAKFFGEKLAVMPGTYQINDHLQEFDPTPVTRKDYKLPEDKFVFCCFSLTHKIEPTMFNSWMNILDKAPESVLWLYVRDKTARKNLVAKAEAHGMDINRIIFADRVPKATHLSRLKLADLGLDTRIYNGHTTTSDTLWAETPVITLKGNHFASRVSASLLNAIKLPELITESFGDFENLAVKLATDKKALGIINKKLAKNRLTTPLFDTPKFAHDLENLYDQMWQRYKSGKAPAHLNVTGKK